MKARKRIALIAHDNKKKTLVDWVTKNKALFVQHDLHATGTTGMLVEAALNYPVEKYQSGPLGGDLQIGALVAEGKLDIIIFFWDPMMAQPHDPDVKALLRIAAVWNVPMAGDEATADFIISSPLMNLEYKKKEPDYSVHNTRKL